MYSLLLVLPLLSISSWCQVMGCVRWGLTRSLRCQRPEESEYPGPWQTDSPAAWLTLASQKLITVRLLLGQTRAQWEGMWASLSANISARYSFPRHGWQTHWWHLECSCLSHFQAVLSQDAYCGLKDKLWHNKVDGDYLSWSVTVSECPCHTSGHKKCAANALTVPHHWQVQSTVSLCLVTNNDHNQLQIVWRHQQFLTKMYLTYF